MEEQKKDFIDSLKRFRAKEKNAIVSLRSWELYSFHFEKSITTCPVCDKSEQGWRITYCSQFSAKITCSICRSCSSLMPKDDYDELMIAYLMLKKNRDAIISDTTLSYCYSAHSIDYWAYMAYLKIKQSVFRNKELTVEQKQLIKAVNYQFLKLLKDRRQKHENKTSPETLEAKSI